MNNNYCCVPQCTSLGSHQPRTSFHRFPSINENSGIRRRQWIAKLRIGKKVTSRMVVCGKHFKAFDFFPSTAGVDGLKRRNLKKTAIPSVNLPTSSESTYEYERSAKLKKTEKSKFKEETPINKILIENTRKDTCFPDEMDSHESFESLEEIGNKLSSSSDEEHMPIEDTEARIGNEIPLSSDEEYLATEYTEARIGNETSLSSDEEHVAIEDTETRNKTSPNSTDNVINSLDTSPNFTNSIKAPKYSDTEDISVDSNKNCIIPHSTVKGNCDFDFSLFKSDSKEILTQKLETALSVNAALQKKLEFYQNKCRTYEKEVKILKGVVDNLKLINSVAPDY